MRSIAIFGATSAIAMACARSWVEKGVTFFLVARNQDKLSQVAEDLTVRGATVYTHVADLNETDLHAGLVRDCCDKLGHIDVALFAAGTLPDQEACEGDAKLAVREFTNNCVSVLALLTGLARPMEAQGAGCIAVISSVAGDRGRPSNYVYGAAKSAVTEFCSGLRGRLHKSGVTVLTIKPGFVDSPMTHGMQLPKRLLASPEKVANDVVTAIRKRRSTLYTPWFWRYIMLIIAHIPGPIFKRLNL